MSTPKYPAYKDTNGWYTRLISVFRKEVRDHFRDRRSLLLALIYPLLGPLLIAGGLSMAGHTIQSSKEKLAFEVVVLGAENAPQLIRHLQKNEITIVPAETIETAKEVVRDGIVSVGLSIPLAAKGQERFTVQMLLNLSRVDNLRKTARLQTVIGQLNAEIARERLTEAGFEKDFARSIKVEDVSISRPPNIAIFFYNMMPPLVIFMLFLGGVHLAIDTTVGERERGSLEPLLLAPVERWVLLLAKSMAAVAFTAITAFVNLAAFAIFLGWAAAGSTLLAAPPSWNVFAAIFVISLPLMFIAVALQMSIAVVTRSMKEAQIYLGLLPLVPALPGMILVFTPITPGQFDVMVPVFGQMLLMSRLIMGEPVLISQVVSASLSTFVAAGLIFLLAAKWFRREKMFVLG
ncbi:MAG: ABC transporter permease [Rhodospirillaceae bacterium]|nr:ABC transporter permease [Rhodospirillaceae bacterium]